MKVVICEKGYTIDNTDCWWNKHVGKVIEVMDTIWERHNLYTLSNADDGRLLGGWHIRIECTKSIKEYRKMKLKKILK